VADPVDGFFERYPADVQTISRILRAMVLETMPGANELLFANQNHVAYSTSASRAGTIVYICPLNSYVRLGFMYGGQLPDPDKVLVGEGKRLRHVKVRSIEQSRDPVLERLVEAAWAKAIVS
jgi:hypothetical protein